MMTQTNGCDLTPEVMARAAEVVTLRLAANARGGKPFFE